MARKNRALFLLSLVCLSPIFADEPPVCTSQHNLNRASLRHIESNGLGYNTGYTTLEGFFVPLPSLNTRWIPFLDVRGHIFNNSKPAANAGIGLRYIADTRVWGSNIYYDYRKTSHHNYNQVSFGLESLGRYLDYRVNGYFPLGKHKSSLYDPHFDSFSGHSLFIARKQELALKGCNGEVGVHIAKVKGIDFYSALGPYYFGNDQKHTFGGQFRIGMDVLSILRLEGNTSYDHLYKWIGQGQISLSYAFTPKTISRKHKKGSCSFHSSVRDRAFQRVDKQEIIVTSTQQKKSIAINPATGLPYTFWFVDNTSHSLGTFESPFNTLADAQSASNVNDIIIVFPGDGTDRGMSNGITLKNGQKLWGASIPHQLSTSLGNITVKPLANQMPTISNSGITLDTNAPPPVITAANSNDIEGLKIDAQIGSSGIFINGKSGRYVIEKNSIAVGNGNGSNGGIFFNNTAAEAYITNNTVSGVDQLQNIGIVVNVCSGNFWINNNTLSTGLSGGISINYNQNILKCFIQDNILNFNPSAQDTVIGIRIGYSSVATNAEVLVANNKINNIPFGLSRVLNGGIGVQVGGNVFVTLRNNQVTTLDTVRMPAYNFQNSGGALLSQINFAPDNIGNWTSSGF